MLERYDVALSGSHVVVVGRGLTVGRPLGLLLARKGIDATVTLTASDPSALDLRMTLVNRGGGTIESVQFPSGLVEDISRVTAGYAPTYLPGVRLQQEFFSRTSAISPCSR